MGRHRKEPFREARICACGDQGFVGLTRGFVCLIDPEDVQEIGRRNWSAMMCKGGPYARSCSRLMHRVLIGAEPGQHVDHGSGDTLDNRRGNITACSASQNVKRRRPSKGRPVPKGVYPQPSGRFVAQICSDGLRRTLGTFPTPEAAAAAYDAAALRLHGDFAFTNAMAAERPRD